MKLGIAKASDAYPQTHLVLVVQMKEASGVGYTIREILPKGIEPIRGRNRTTGDWIYRFDISYLEMLMLAFPTADLSEGLHKRLIKLTQREIDNMPVPKLKVPGLIKVWPAGTPLAGEPFRLFNFQKVAIEMIVRYLKGEISYKDFEPFLAFLQNDEMGLGKTLMALCALRLAEAYPALIIAPKNGLTVWEREAMQKLGLCVTVVSADRMNMAQRRAAIDARDDMTVIIPETTRGRFNWTYEDNGKRADRIWAGNIPELYDYEYDTLVVDEYHRYGNLDAQQTQGYLQIQSKRLLPMSGTPFMNTPLELFPTLHKMAPDLYPDYETYRLSIGIYEQGKPRPVGYKPKQMKKLKKFIDANSIRRRRDHVIKDLPKEHIVTVPIQLTKEQRKIYNVVRDEFKLVLESGEKVPMTSVRSHIMRLKQACFSPELFGGSKHSAKIDELQERLDELVASGEKALLGSEWAKAARIMEREFARFNPAYVDGTIASVDKRQAQADKFNTDEDCKLFIGTIKANREAISLPAASYVGFSDEEWSPQVNAQFIARSAVGGLRGLDAKVEQVIILKFRAEDTVEERLEEYLREKANLFSSVVDKDGGGFKNRTEAKSLLDIL